MPPVHRRPSNPCAIERLQEMVNKMNDSVKKRSVKVNVGKTKVMVFERGESPTECDIFKEGEKVEQMKELVWLGRMFTNDTIIWYHGAEYKLYFIEI
ncbi:hypothetical protein EVAR_99927_1 [Eumeta japonica]|uniref:Uncharacterized protein n=1 Tax=Eumeta variegata TaxID=151549 RepID=A0A4C1Z0U7_EUMVA|nr:hypothetical protein EVAR_99927_1 [Eumeta japonica]